MTHYALPRESGHARSSSTSAQRCRKARCQESPGDGRFSELREAVTWLEERVKSVWGLELRDGLRGHARKPKKRAVQERRQ